MNTFLLWRWEHESRCLGQNREAERSQRIFWEALVNSLLGPPPSGRGGGSGAVSIFAIFRDINSECLTNPEPIESGWVVPIWSVTTVGIGFISG